MHHLHSLYAPLLLVVGSWLALALGGLWLAAWERRRNKEQ